MWKKQKNTLTKSKVLKNRFLVFFEKSFLNSIEVINFPSDDFSIAVRKAEQMFQLVLIEKNRSTNPEQKGNEKILAKFATEEEADQALKALVKLFKRNPIQCFLGLVAKIFLVFAVCFAGLTLYRLHQATEMVLPPDLANLTKTSGAMNQPPSDWPSPPSDLSNQPKINGIDPELINRIKTNAIQGYRLPDPATLSFPVPNTQQAQSQTADPQEINDVFQKSKQK